MLARLEVWTDTYTPLPRTTSSCCSNELLELNSTTYAHTRWEWGVDGMRLHRVRLQPTASSATAHHHE